MPSVRRLVDYDRWPPLKTVPKLQSDALPNAYQAAVVEELKLLRRNLGSIKDSPDIVCYKCGKKGHIKPNCPENDVPGGEFKKKDSGPERMFLLLMVLLIQLIGTEKHGIGALNVVAGKAVGPLHTPQTPTQEASQLKTRVQ